MRSFLPLTSLLTIHGCYVRDCHSPWNTSEHYCCNNCISVFLLCSLPGYRKYCLGMLIYVCKAEGQGSSLDMWSALLLLPSVSPAIASTEEQKKTLKKYKWTWSWSCLTFEVALCTIIVFKRAFIFGPWATPLPPPLPPHPPSPSASHCLSSWCPDCEKGVVTLLQLTGLLHRKLSMHIAYSERLWVCVDIVVPWHSADPNGSIFVCFVIHLLLDTAKTIRPNRIWVVQFSADFRKPYLSLFQAGLLQQFPGNPSASVARLPKSLLEQPSHRHGAESGRSVPFPKCSNWFSSSLKQCWALSGMFLCGTKSSSTRWITH